MLSEIRDLVAYHSRSTSRFAEHDVRNVYGKAVRDIRAFDFGEIKSKKILDLGCGQRFPFALQAAADGAVVTALDLDYVKPDFPPLAFVRMTRTNGLKRAIKSTVRKTLWDSKYYDALERASGRPLWKNHGAISFVQADPTAARYPLPDSTWDLIVSNAVLEHVADIPRLAQEIERLLIPGGYFYAIIHNFYSLSGGHNLEWAFPDEHPSTHIPPWDHLRGNRHPTFVYLNRLKPDEYLAAFSKTLEICRFEGVGITHDSEEMEGKDLLTDAIERELPALPRGLLLTRSWCLVGRKRPHPK